jgi:hypothetical protein
VSEAKRLLAIMSVRRLQLRHGSVTLGSSTLRLGQTLKRHSPLTSKSKAASLRIAGGVDADAGAIVGDADKLNASGLKGGLNFC